MSAHTPGPWTAFVGTRNGVVGHGTVAVELTRAPVAELAPGLRAIVESNARLIAAAPDLLEVAERFVSDRNNRHASYCGSDTRCACGLTAARAAIAKARGES